MPTKEVTCKPFLKWAGGKGQLLTQIKEHLPSELGTTINKYVEPFIGGGALLFEVLNTYDIKEVFISDINTDLINTYITIRDDVDAMVKELQTMQDEYWPLDIDERKAYYLEKRTLFNKLREENSGKHVLTISALFTFLNKTCFNGLYRLNKRGGYNVPMGGYKFPPICDRENLYNVSRLLQGVTIANQSFLEAIHHIDKDTFVYFDPPYRPISDTSAFTSYNASEFGDAEQIGLAEFCHHVSSMGAKWMLSNSDPTALNPEDIFFDELYKDYKIRRVYASRAINSKGSSRGKIPELLITNY